MREFRKLLFMGRGELSEFECNKLKKMLGEALDINCGLQQIPHYDHDPSQEELDQVASKRFEYGYRVMEIAMDIFTALTDMEVTGVKPAKND